MQIRASGYRFHADACLLADEIGLDGFFHGEVDTGQMPDVRAVPATLPHPNVSVTWQDGQPLGNSVQRANLSPERMLARFAAMEAPDAGASHEIWLAALDD